VKLLVALLAIVWAVDDGERIARDTRSPPLATGVDNPVWRPGGAIRLFAMRDEVVAFQIVVEGPADGVTVDVKLEPAIGVERFVEHWFHVGRSRTDGHDYSESWAEGSGPRGDRFTGWLPDALIPVEHAPEWAPWPMRVAAGQNGVVWIDLTVPRDLESRKYDGTVEVRAGATTLATLPLELEVLPATMPARPVGTMLFYGRDEIARRIGNLPATERQLLTLFHGHRVTPLVGIDSVEAVREYLPLLDGSLFTKEHGYSGPAAGVADGVIVLGTYGTYGNPNPEKLVRVEKIADELAAHRLFDTTDVILYAEDEDCTSTRGGAWRQALLGSANANARRVRVGWTCSDDPTGQAVDVPIVDASAYDPTLAARARALGKETWIYNGARPATGTMLTDDAPISMRTYGWIAAMAAIPRWFLWETTFWYDGNRGGHGPYDPFATAETFHNADNEASMGGGVLVYPGRQIDRFAEHSVGFDGVVASIRLKNLRRGIQDAGYLELARGARGAEADAIARALFPRILGEPRPGTQPSWSEEGRSFFEARAALAQMIGPGADPGPSATVGKRPFRIQWRKRYTLVCAVFVAALLALLMRRRQRRPAR
jgi:hypothetical protein